MTENLDLQTLLDQNPRARSQADEIERAQEMLRLLKENGVPPHAYDLEPPFGARSWLRHPSLAGKGARHASTAVRRAEPSGATEL